jgi:hypothetical protein
LRSFATISFTRFCCGLFLIHSIRFDRIALTVDVRDGSQFADVRRDDLIAELLPLLAGPDRNTFPPPPRRVPEASGKPGQLAFSHSAQGACCQLGSGTARVIRILPRPSADVLMLLANVRGGINSLMAEVMEDHIRHHLLSTERNSTPPHELAEDMIDLVRAYLK